MSEKLVLDFNSANFKLKLSDVSRYNVDTIYKNIDAFRKFVYESVIFVEFDKIYKTSVFQLTLLDKDSNYIENLVAVYNAIAQGNFLEGTEVPAITEKQMVTQLKARGFNIYYSNLKLFDGEYKHVRKVSKKNKTIY